MFSRLGPLQDQSFLDLCTGSGQMALEAYSRGANVIACDDNDKRCRILKDLLEAWHVDENLQLINTKAQILIGQQNRQYVRGYIHPPKDSTLSGRPLSIILAEQVGQKSYSITMVYFSCNTQYDWNFQRIWTDCKQNASETTAIPCSLRMYGRKTVVSLLVRTSFLTAC